jgi:hypothetical protein
VSGRPLAGAMAVSLVAVVGVASGMDAGGPAPPPVPKGTLVEYRFTSTDGGGGHIQARQRGRLKYASEDPDGDAGPGGSVRMSKRQLAHLRNLVQHVRGEHESTRRERSFAGTESQYIGLRDVRRVVRWITSRGEDRKVPRSARRVVEYVCELRAGDLTRAEHAAAGGC